MIMFIVFYFILLLFHLVYEMKLMDVNFISFIIHVINSIIYDEYEAHLYDYVLLCLLFSVY